MTALIAAGLFLTHPIQTQAVTYLCQRFASLATLFYLLAVCLYLKARATETRLKTLFYFLAVCAGLTGMFTKQIVLTLPITIFLVEWLFLNTDKRSRSSLRSQWGFIMAMLALFLIIPAVYSFNIQTILFRQYESLSHTGDTLDFISYFLTQSRVIWTYISLLIFPIGQNLLYDYPASYTVLDPKVILGFSGIGLLLFLAIRLRETKPFVSFGILWFFTTLLVESSVIPIRHVIFEHRCYLPFFGFSLVAGFLFTEIIKDRYKLTAAILGIVMTLSVLTYKRNEIWADDITLWTDVIKKSPNVIRPYTHLATAYLNQKDFDSALNAYTRAIVLDPGQAESYNNRGNVYTVLNQHELALKDYLKALSIDPTLEKTYNNIGIIHNKRKDFKRALVYYNKALELNADNAGVYYNRANVYLQLNHLDKAFADYSQSIKLNPFQKKALYYRSQIYASEQKFADALADVEKAQTLGLKIDQEYINQLRIKINQ
ncbi:MAG: tetratricopeptide repeat protein [Candidatus Omnitrophota bacterium]